MAYRYAKEGAVIAALVGMGGLAEAGGAASRPKSHVN